MLDFIVLFFAARTLGTRLRAKGYRAIWFQVLLVVVWIVGEVVGAVVGVIAAEAKFGGAQQNKVLIGLFGLFGAGLGAVLIFAIANQLPDVRRGVVAYPEQDYYRNEVDRGPASGESYRAASDEHFPQ